MTEDWGEEAETPRPKGGLPKWVWWTCGLGCAAAVLVAVVAGIAIALLVKQGSDPEVTIPKVMRYLPCDEWPEGYFVKGGFEIFGMGTFTISGPTGIALLQPWPSKPELDQQMTAGSVANFTLSDDVEGEMELQGRTVRTLSFRQFGQPGLRVDVTGDDPPLATLTLMHEGDSPEPEHVVRFLEPFDLWRGED